jgi:hypothetical protein
VRCSAVQVKGRISMVGGRASLWTDILRQVENGTFRSCSSPEQCSARKRLGRERPKNAGSLQQAVNPCPRLQHLAIMGAREHRRGRAIVFPVSCSNSIHTGDCSSALRSLHVMASLHDGVPLLHVPNGDDALLASLWSRDCIFAPEAGTRPSSNSGQ